MSSVSVRALFVLVLVAMLVASEAAPQRFGGRRFNRRRGGRPLLNALGRFLGGGGRSNTQANANVIQAQQGGNSITNVNANVVNQNNGGFGVSGGVAVASNLQFNGPFGTNINLSNAQAQTINRGFNFFGRRR